MTNTKRSYIPGSEWLYYKLYTGPKTADRLLTDLVYPVTYKLIDKKLIEKWFFIRYSDPKFHLRIRLKVRNLKDIGEVINDFAESSIGFFNEDLLWSIQLDTYQREIERYGSSTIDASETIFYNDSSMILNFLNLVDDDKQAEDLRWLFGIKTIDTFLDDFSYLVDDKLTLMEKLKLNFSSEFNLNRHLKKQLDKKYINNEKKITQFINLKSDDQSAFSSLAQIIDIKSIKSKSVILEVKKVTDPLKLNSFLGSHIHMMMNRLFRSKNRLHEMVIYYFLFKYYKAVVGKRKHQLNNQEHILKASN